jgi:hypothetical protein
MLNSIRTLWRSAREVQMHGRSFEEVVVDFVEVGDKADQMCWDVALVVEGFETAPDTQVLPFFGLRLGGLRVCVAVDPLLDLNEAGAVVDFEGCVGGLWGDGVDLADEGYLVLDENLS